MIYITCTVLINAWESTVRQVCLLLVTPCNSILFAGHGRYSTKVLEKGGGGVRANIILPALNTSASLDARHLCLISLNYRNTPYLHSIKIYTKNIIHPVPTKLMGLCLPENALYRWNCPKVHEVLSAWSVECAWFYWKQCQNVLN